MKRVSLYETLWHIRTLTFSFYILLSCRIHYEVHFCVVGSVAILSIFSLSTWDEDLVFEIMFCVSASLVGVGIQPSLGSRRS